MPENPSRDCRNHAVLMAVGCARRVSHSSRIFVCIALYAMQLMMAVKTTARNQEEATVIGELPASQELCER